MSSFIEQPTANAGRWNISEATVQTHVLQRGKVKEHRFFIEWLNADGEHKLTLVADQGFTTKKEAEAFVADTNSAGYVKAIEAKDYDPESDVPQWTKHHASPHPEAKHSDFPWGSAMSFSS